jgi:predicted RNA-binding protein YlxR (DUF448 family)
MGCMRRDAQDAMARIVVVGHGARIDNGARRAPGRGGYLHWLDECLARFERGSKEREFRSLRRRIGRTERIALTASIRALLVSRTPLE